MTVTLQELVLAYRKVKMHLYQQRSQPRLFKILSFEKELEKNFSDLIRKLNEGAYDDVISQCSGYCLLPYRETRVKEVGKPVIVEVGGSGARWNGGKTTLYTRTLADIPIACELVFTLWICRMGHVLDGQLMSCVLGDRLQNSANGEWSLEGNQLYRGYSASLGRFQRQICTSLKRFLAGGRDVVLYVTELRDVSAYEVCPTDVVQILPEKMRTEVDGDELTQLVSKMLAHWRVSGGEETEKLPIGSTVGGLLSNLWLTRVDKALQNAAQKELLYLRCGKVIALVLPDDHQKDPRDTFATIVDAMKGALGYQGDEDVVHEYRTRICCLSGEAGLDYVESFEKMLEEDDSFWNRLPEGPNDPTAVRGMHSAVVAARDDCGLQFLTELSLSRRRFVKQINDMEDCLANLVLNDWRDSRLEFLKTIRDSYCDVVSVFSFYSFYPRILALAFASSLSPAAEEFCIAEDIIERILSRMKAVADKQADDCKDVAKRDEISNRWGERLCGTLADCIVERLCATVQKPERSGVLIRALCHRFPDFFKEYDEGKVAGLPTYLELQNHDLADAPFKNTVWKYRWRGVPLDEKQIPSVAESLAMAIPSDVRTAFDSLWRKMNGKAVATDGSARIPLALFFAVRGVDAIDLSLAFSRFSVEEGRDAGLILPYFGRSMSFPSAQDVDKHVCHLTVPFDGGSSKYRIGLVSWKTEDATWNAVACGRPDPKLIDRFQRLAHLVNQVLSLPENVRPHYLMMPELAISPQHFCWAARRLAQRGVSFISGVDYLRHAPVYLPNGEMLNVVTNEVWCSLCTMRKGGRPVIVRFVKSRLAQEEGTALYNISHTVCLRAAQSMPQKIVTHGHGRTSLVFGLLICSDVLNVDYRSLLRGNVDLLVIPAWNKDVPTYSSLVDATAVDLHTYVALVNSRTYGDTRLRAPAKESYERDVVQLRGGIDDFFVVGEIDVEALRKFQSYYKSPDKPFKPVPTGFEISEDRKCVP